MEGPLEKFDTDSAGMFSSGSWKKYFFILHERVLIICDFNERSKIVGRLHMEISQVLPEKDDQQEGEIRLHSGLFEVRIKASSIKEKINWKNAFHMAQKGGQ